MAKKIIIITFIETLPHNITNLMDGVYLQDVDDYTSLLNSSTTTINTTDNNSERNKLRQRLNELPIDGGVSASRNHDPEPAGGDEPSKLLTRSHSGGSTTNQSD